jgi:hypothetical protein
MTNRPIAAHELRALWQTLPTTPVIISTAEMRARAEKFQSHIRRRNLIEYGAIAFVVTVFGWYATWRFPETPLWPIANLMIIAGALVSGFNLHRRARASGTPQAGSATDFIAFHRAELTRQRDAVLSAWRWYLLPSLPGLLVWLVALAVGSSNTPHPGAVIVAIVLVVLCFVAVVSWMTMLQLLGAARLQRMIEDLDRYREMQ